MTYKQALFFVGQSLTINDEIHNRVLIKQKLEAKTVDWESILKVSSEHFVIPALYYNFKRASLLNYLPEDLISFMKKIADLNHERNRQIIVQAKEINNLLIQNEIKPIFLKGAGNLLNNLYEDIGERMVGDIDFIVSKKEYQKAIEVLKKDGYRRTEKNLIGFHKHYPRLVKDNNIAAVEVHNNFFETKLADTFNYNTIKDTIHKEGLVNFLSFQDQYYLTIFAYQINDYGYSSRSISLRSAYDTILISKRIAPNALKRKFSNNNSTIINCYAAVVNYTFNNIESLTVLETKKKDIYIKDFNRIFFNRKKYKIRIYFIRKLNRLKYNLNLITKALYRKQYTIYVFKKAKERFQNIITVFSKY